MTEAGAAAGGAPTVGVDIGGTKVLAVAVGAGGRPVAERRLPTPDRAAGVRDGVAALVEELTGGEVGALGVGIPGMVDGEGTLRSAPHLPGLVGAQLAADLLDAYPAARVWVGNDATAAGWAEHALGAAAGADDVLTVTLGTGIGGGLVAGGRLVEGAHRFAGEIGHMVVDPHGPPCPCGQRGCWEQMASGSGLGRMGREWAVAGRAPRLVALAGGDPEGVRGEHVTAAARAGDPAAVELMAELGWWLALGLANLTNVLDPDVVVIGGGLVEAGDLLLAPTRRAFAAMVEGYDQRPHLAVVAAALGPRAGAIGAGLLAARSGT